MYKPLSLSASFFSSGSDVISGSGSIKLTGDSRADADILAFIKARQTLLQQRGVLFEIDFFNETVHLARIKAWKSKTRD